MSQSRSDSCPPEAETTHFGFATVAKHAKAGRVRGVFDSVAPQYDLMNDLMSLGLHRWWKRMAIMLAAVRPGQQVLDCAAGTGDLTRLLAKAVGPEGRVIMSDINAEMLQRGRAHILDHGLNQVMCAQINAEHLPFARDTFDAVTIGFGLRNVTDQAKALAEMRRVCRPGGRVVVLEFSQPQSPLLARAYDWYSFNVLPRLGEWVADNADSYRYLAESIRRHPNQNQLKAIMEQVGFVHVAVHNYLNGIVAVHRGIVA